MYKLLVVGLDQSYTRCGISIAADGVLLKVTSEAFSGLKTKSEKRKRIRSVLTSLLGKVVLKASRVAIILERIRLTSQGNISINYMKATGALIGTIVDTAEEFDVRVYSVDTRSWKAQVVGNCKPEGTGKLAPKWPTIKYVCRLGWKSSIHSLNKQGGDVWDDDASDSACIALYGFVPAKHRKLQREE